RALRELTKQRKLDYLKKNHFALARRNHSDRDRPRQFADRVSSSANLISGRLIAHRDGYGFVVPDKPLAQTDLDIFIPPDAMGSAMHGDRVEVRVTRAKRDGRIEGRIHRIAERANKTVVGEFHAAARYNYVTPFDQRVAKQILIPAGQETPPGDDAAKRHRQFGGESEGKSSGQRAPASQKARELDGQVVDVELTQFPRPGELGQPRGRVIEVLGRRDDFGVDVEIMIRKFHLPHRFPAEVLDEAAAHPQQVTDDAMRGRRDFRSLRIVTIDGETAKDFDDAVYVERRAHGGYQLQVHIADVAHYVRLGTALDREARLRGTSVYFPDRAVPMLPLELSNGICSLNPHQDRLVMSALMELDARGRIVKYELVPGVMHSAERMTYTSVRDILAGEAAAVERHRKLVDNFNLMEELARLLNARRDERGSIDFDLPEPEIEFDEHGRMIGVTRSERNIAHRIIEEFMLAANECVARYFEHRGVPALYRIHEKPDAKKVLEFEEIAATFGYSLGIELPAARRLRVRRQDERERHPRFHEQMDEKEIKITPFHYQKLTARIAGKPEERILSYLMLRSLKQARYSEENEGHFALASPTYTHFTSPIRRYPDLIVHRILKALLAEAGGNATAPFESGASHERTAHAKQHPRREPVAKPSADGGARVSPEELHALGIETSESERRAQDAERELMEWKKVRFMADKLGEEFDALIISLIKYGFFVELTDLFVEGFVPIDSLDDDRYVYRERLRAMVGQYTKKAYHLGERVKVRLDRIEREGDKLQFSVVP
ncbi:MAG: ribonuclease R family protein, partial [Deltaproteobacteria bacterium]